MTSKTTLLIPILEEILVKEIGEANIPILNWKQTSPFKYKFLADIGKYTEVVTVDFDLFDEVGKEYYISPKYHHLKDLYNI